MGKHGEEGVPRAIAVEDDGWFFGEIWVESLVAYEDGNGFEHVLQSGSRSEEKGIGFDDLFLNVVESDFLISVGIVDVPTFVEEEGKKLSASGTPGIIGPDDSAGKSNCRHATMWYKKGSLHPESANFDTFT